jgi:hypothetical protein
MLVPRVSFLCLLAQIVESLFCPGDGSTLNSSGGIITSGSIQDSFSDKLCSWILRPSEGAAVDLTFSDLHLSNGFDQVSVYSCFDFNCTLALNLEGSPYTLNKIRDGSALVNRKITSYTGIMKLEFFVYTYDGYLYQSHFTATFASGG